MPVDGSHGRASEGGRPGWLLPCENCISDPSSLQRVDSGMEGMDGGTCTCNVLPGSRCNVQRQRRGPGALRSTGCRRKLQSRSFLSREGPPSATDSGERYLP